MKKHWIDFSKYYDTDLNIYNIGWLDPTDNFATQKDNNNIVNKLSCILKRERVNLTRGIYTCPLCHNKIYTKWENKDQILGISEIWIPNENETKIFAAPDLVIHYMDFHFYQPPQEFIDSVVNFNLDSKWSGKTMYEKFTEAKYR